MPESAVQPSVQRTRARRPRATVTSGPGPLGKRARRLIDVGAEGWRALARAVGRHAAIRFSLRTQGFPRTARKFGLVTLPASSPGPSGGRVLSRDSVLTLWAADRALRPKILGATCLSKTLTTQRLLAATGINTEIVIGVAHADGFSAHAWLELEGRPLIGGSGDEYRVIARFGERTE